MTKKLTPLQVDILRLAETRNLAGMTYREVASYVGGVHPYSVQLAINKLIDKGMLAENKYTGEIFTTKHTDSSTKPLLHIPILGWVSCGPAAELAFDEPSGYVTVSPSTVSMRDAGQTYALMARGESMTAARINSKNVEDGDYVIVHKSKWGDAKDGDYVVSRFNDMNNLKRLCVDRANHRVVLLSDSVDSTPPIIISEADMEYYAIEGVAIDVIKRLPSQFDAVTTSAY